MKRLLTTVAFSALILGGAASGWAQSTTQGTMGTTGKTTTSDAAGQPTRNGDAKAPIASNKTTSPSQGAVASSTASSSSTDQMSAAPKAKHKRAHHAMARSGDDRSADELNRQELAKITSSSTSYGSGDTTAPSSGTTR